jgi:antitoxin CptB
VTKGCNGRNIRMDTRRKRLLFRSLRRGTKESDLVIGGFARACLSDLNDAQLDQFEALLDQNDPDVLAWVIGIECPPPEFDTDVLSLLRTHRDRR